MHSTHTLHLSPAQLCISMYSQLAAQDATACQLFLALSEWLAHNKRLVSTPPCIHSSLEIV